ncbi:pseudaminic acid synthase [Candidatus Marinamargulisbacteria bacterium SCGC AAA071-K20]|nr:pseudaminic acid synthase [Candidatus Marinamargulisbacteria bacterium SCGC AAA071-K20]
MHTLKINSQDVGNGHPVYFIAEMSGNHGGSKDKALELVRLAKEAGADAIKLQTYRADTITLNSNNKDFAIAKDDPWHYKGNLFALYEEAFTPWEWHADLFAEANKIGIHIFSSPFDLTAVDFLEDLNCPAYKVASPEITDIPLIAKVAKTGKPVIVSTGLAELKDIELCLSTLKENGCTDYAFLKCTASYPAPFENMNLNVIPDLASKLDCPIGLSDHTMGYSVPLASVALGATIIEKHFKAHADDDTVDSFFSLDKHEFKQMISEVRNVEKALGRVSYEIPGNPDTKFKARRSLYVSSPIKKGEKITEDNIKSVRPSWGLHPKHYDAILGKTVNTDLELGDRLRLDFIND